MATRSRPEDERVSFNDWIEETGIDVVAKFLHVHPNTILNWMRGHCDPRVDQMRRIKKWTNGAMGYDQIIDRKVKPLSSRRGA